MLFCVFLNCIRRRLPIDIPLSRQFTLSCMNVTLRSTCQARCSKMQSLVEYFVCRRTYSRAWTSGPWRGLLDAVVQLFGFNRVSENNIYCKVLFTVEPYWNCSLWTFFIQQLSEMLGWARGRWWDSRHQLQSHFVLVLNFCGLNNFKTFFHVQIKSCSSCFLQEITMKTRFVEAPMKSRLRATRLGKNVLSRLAIEWDISIVISMTIIIILLQLLLLSFRSRPTLMLMGTTPMTMGINGTAKYS